MSDMLSGKAPWHLWAVGVLGILWNGFGCFDYTMTNMQGDAYLTAAGMTAEQIAHMNAMPAWMSGVWAIGVWGGLIGCVLLLLRNKLALPVFIASGASFVFSVIYSRFIDPMPAGGPHAGSMDMMHLIIFAGCVFFIWYAMFAKKRGIIR